MQEEINEQSRKQGRSQRLYPPLFLLIFFCCFSVTKKCFKSPTEPNIPLFLCLTYRHTLKRSIVNVLTWNVSGFKLDPLAMIFLHCYMDQSLKFHNCWCPKVDVVLCFPLNVKQKRMKLVEDIAWFIETCCEKIFSVLDTWHNHELPKRQSLLKWPSWG